MNRILPPTYLLMAILLMIVLHIVLPLTTVVSFPWSLAGLAPLLTGLALNILADRSFKRHRTTVKPFENLDRTHDAGRVRYQQESDVPGNDVGSWRDSHVAAIGITMAGCLRVSSPTAEVFITREEEMLQERFGDQFREYLPEE